MKKYKFFNMLVKASGTLMALALIVADLSTSSTCLAIFHQPKVPASLLEQDN